jgi:hypothetical protein
LPDSRDKSGKRSGKPVGLTGSAPLGGARRLGCGSWGAAGGVRQAGCGSRGVAAGVWQLGCGSWAAAGGVRQADVEGGRRSGRGSAARMSRQSAERRMRGAIGRNTLS